MCADFSIDKADDFIDECNGDVSTTIASCMFHPSKRPSDEAFGPPGINICLDKDTFKDKLVPLSCTHLLCFPSRWWGSDPQPVTFFQEKSMTSVALRWAVSALLLASSALAQNRQGVVVNCNNGQSLNKILSKLNKQV